MTPADAVDSPGTDRLLAALRAGRFDEAEAALADPASPPDPQRQLRLAEMLMRRRQWAQAAWLFSRLPQAATDAAAVVKRRLAANLAALQRHRPAVYEALVALPAQQQFFVAATASGRASVHYRRVDGSLTSLSAGPDPLAAAGATLSQLYERTPGGEAIALCGVGDGYLTRLLAQRPPELFMDKEQPVYLIEPEPQVLLQCLMIHDYAGAAGPIESDRFRWFVGPEWDAALERELFDNQYLPVPSVTVGQGYDTPRVQERLRVITQKLVDRDAELAAAIKQHYEGLRAGDFADAFGGAAGRQPRVLLLTTRFSTVLQYSTRDTAAAFERLGWEARVVVEPSPHHRVLRSAIAAAVAEFRPDLVFQIDHLRPEHQGLFPENLPFACWIQDHLPHLACPELGRRLGEFDFVLTDAIATYAEKFDYPARQCIPLPKLVVPTEVAAAGDEPADDIVFVSNASRAAEAMTAEAVARHGANPHSRELIGRCCARIIETYDAGGSLPTYQDVCAVLRSTLKETGMSVAADGFDVLARWLTHPFNDALYRQQALRWAAVAAQERGLSLALYGKGWEAHPEFRPHARGPVAYGEPLRRLTRRSRINLQIVPYLCLHQRLLDGLMAGGFFLIRTHPSDVLPAVMLRLLAEFGAADVGSTSGALAVLPPHANAALAQLVEQCRPCLCTTGTEDVVAMVRAWEDAGQLTASDGPLPMLADVGFEEARGLAVRIEKFVAAPGLRESIVQSQRRSIGLRLSYDAGIRRVVNRICELLQETAGQCGARQVVVAHAPEARAA
jgi:hypothetical protein